MEYHREAAVNIKIKHSTLLPDFTVVVSAVVRLLAEGVECSVIAMPIQVPQVMVVAITREVVVVLGW